MKQISSEFMGEFIIIKSLHYVEYIYSTLGLPASVSLQWDWGLV